MTHLVIGAGVAGLAIAAELAARGAPVRILDRNGPPGPDRCSWWAGGMLAPFCEFENAEEPVLRLGRLAADWWEARAGGVTRRGTLVVAPTRDRSELRRFARRTEGFRKVDAGAIAALEPELAGRFHQGLFFEQEAHLDPRAALAALTARLAAQGVEVEREEASTAVEAMAPWPGGAHASAAAPPPAPAPSPLTIGAMATSGPSMQARSGAAMPGAPSLQDVAPDAPTMADAAAAPSGAAPSGQATAGAADPTPARIPGTTGEASMQGAAASAPAPASGPTGASPLPSAPRPARPRIIDCRGLAARDMLPDLRGVKGEMLVLRAPDIRITRPIRLLHPRIPLYIVPRGNGIYMLGATMIEAEAAGRFTVRSALEMLSAAYALHPGFGEAEILETGVDARPAFPDNLPRLRIAGGRLHANGLHRHGYLLAPALAMQAADLLLDDARPELLEDAECA